MDKELFNLKPGDKLYSHKYEIWLTIFSVSTCIGYIQNNIFTMELVTKSVPDSELYFSANCRERLNLTLAHIGINDIGLDKKFLTEVQYKFKKRNAIINDLL